MPTLTALTDEELVTRCKTQLPRDTSSYELLVQRHMDRVYNLVYRIVGNKEEAEDITQDVFIKAYNNLKKFEQQASFSSWIYRIATNSALDALDKIKRRPQSASPISNSKTLEGEEETNPIHLQPSSEAGPEEHALQDELRECINKVLKELDREQAHLLVLRDFDDMSYDEIARTLRVGLSAVKMRIHRARLAFQSIFSDFCGQLYLNFSAPTGADKGKLENE